MSKILAVAAVVLFSIFSESSAQYLLSPVNLGFEQTRVGERPFGWNVQPDEGWYFLAGAENPAAGKMSGELGKINTFGADSVDYAAATMTLDAAPYRGRPFKLKAAVRSSTGDTSDAFLFLTVKMPHDYKGDADVMAVVKIASKDWQIAEADLEIPREAETVGFGIATNRRATAWIDEISIVAPEPDEPPAAASDLSDNDLRKLTIFAKSYGDLRYYHPTTEALKADWESIALRGVRKFLKINESGQAYMDSLKEYFAPVAPLAFFSRTRMKASADMEPPKGAKENFAQAWEHSGIGTSMNSELIFSDTLNVYESQRKREAAAIQNIDAKPLRGRKVRFSVATDFDSRQAGSHTEIWMRGDREENRVAFMLRKPKKTEGKPERIFIDADIPDDATILRLGLVFIGEGEGKFDDAKLDVMEGKSAVPVEILNPGFEEDSRGDLNRGWAVPGTVREVGYSPKLKKSDLSTQGVMLSFVSDTADQIRVPKPGAMYNEDIGSGYEFNFPLSIFADSLGTIPHAEKVFPLTSATYNVADRNSRLAIVMVAWNILRHFNEAQLTEKQLDAALAEALKSAAKSDSERDLLENVRKLVTYFGDAQARVWSSSINIEFLPPFDWTLDNGKIMITSASKESGLSAGDEVIEIDGRPAADALKDFSSRFAGAKNWNAARALYLIRAGTEGSEISVKTRSDKGLKNFTGKRVFVPADFGFAHPENYSDLGGDIYYVDMTTGTDAELKRFAPKISGAKGIIFDARGSTSMSEHFLGYFSDSTMQSVEWKTPIFTKPGRATSYNSIKGAITPLKILKGTPVVFLASERSVGYSEAILWLAQERIKAKIVGTGTAGGMGEVFATRLPGGLYFTASVVQGYSDRGEKLFGRPIKPDVTVENGAKAISQGRDEQLERAKEILLNGK